MAKAANARTPQYNSVLLDTLVIANLYLPRVSLPPYLCLRQIARTAHTMVLLLKNNLGNR